MTHKDFVKFQEDFRVGRLSVELPKSGMMLQVVGLLGPNGFESNDHLSNTDKGQFLKIFKPEPLKELGCLIMKIDGDFLLIAPELIEVEESQILCTSLDRMIARFQLSQGKPGQHRLKPQIDLGYSLQAMESKGAMVIIPGENRRKPSLLSDARTAADFNQGMNRGYFYGIPI